MASSFMRNEMRAQPDLLADRAAPLFAEAKNAAPSTRPELVVLTARGSSDNACLYARYVLESRLQIACSLAAPSVLTRYGSEIRYPASTLFVGVSQSAAAPDVAEVLAYGRRLGHRTLSITNAESGVVVDAAEHNIFLGAGEERAVAATKTFSLTMLALYQVARALGAPLPEPDLAAPVAAMLDDDSAITCAQALIDAELSFTLARGFHFSIAHEAALKLMECALIASKPFSLADFVHGPIALAGPRTHAFVLGTDENDQTSLAVRERLGKTGASVFQAPSAPRLVEDLRPIPSAVFAQRVAYEAACLRGLDPDQPRNLTKVTTTR